MRAIIFFRSKIIANILRIIFGLSGLNAGELHGNLSQEERLAPMAAFREGTIDFLLCTDIAARSLDISGVSAEVNYSMPNEYNTYLHRIGRTTRVGQSGTTIILVEESDRKNMKEAITNSSLPLQAAKCTARSCLKVYRNDITNGQRYRRYTHPRERRENYRKG